MFLVTDVPFYLLLNQSGFKTSSFEIIARYGSIETLLGRYCKEYKTAEMYWSNDMYGIHCILNRHGIRPVGNVNCIQKNTMILYCYNDSIAELIEIKNIRRVEE